MVEQAVVRTVALSTRHPTVKISMSILIDFDSPEYSVEVSRPPSLIPIELIEPMWSNGIDAGVLQAVHEASHILSVAGINIKIRSLDISESLDTLDKEEIYGLGSELKSMTYETLFPIFSKKSNSAS